MCSFERRNRRFLYRYWLVCFSHDGTVVSFPELECSASLVENRSIPWSWRICGLRPLLRSHQRAFESNLESRAISIRLDSSSSVSFSDRYLIHTHVFTVELSRF